MKWEKWRWGVWGVMSAAVMLGVWGLGDRGGLKINDSSYLENYHYFEDRRVDGKSEGFFRKWWNFDGQWYLKITNEGYRPVGGKASTERGPDNVSYAFFPLFTALLWLIKGGAGGNEWAGIVINNLLFLAALEVLFRTIKKTEGSGVAIRSMMLMAAYPWGIFFRAGYTESLYLLLMAAWVKWMGEERWVWASLAAGLMGVTRGVGMLLVGWYGWKLVKQVRQKKLEWSRALVALMVCVAPVLVWWGFNYRQTGDAWYFAKVQDEWNGKNPLLNNLKILLVSGDLIREGHWVVGVNLIAMLFSIWVLVRGWRKLPRDWWWILAVLAVVPMVTTVSIAKSYARFISVAFPLFVYMGGKLKTKEVVMVSGVGCAVMVAVGLCFTNWVWVG